MLFLLSPAKSLDYESPLPAVTASQPQFVAQSTALIATLKKKTPKQIAELMDLSEALKPAIRLAEEAGCRFAARCKHARAECLQATPPLREASPGHKVACILESAIN